jgi:plasmid maintenance system antidote protein VapI
MSVRMKGRHIRRIVKTKLKKSIPWRQAARKDLQRYSEGGQMLRGSRHKRDITQCELAEAISVSPHHISEMENGKRPIGKEMAKRLASFFKTDYRVFL